MSEEREDEHGEECPWKHHHHHKKKRKICSQVKVKVGK
jgi:hypothetical protein